MSTSWTPHGSHKEKQTLCESSKTETEGIKLSTESHQLKTVKSINKLFYLPLT